MTAAGWDPPPEDSAAPAGNGGEQQADIRADIHQQDMALVCPTLHLPGGLLLQCRSVEPWTPQRGYRLRAEAALRLPPLPSGHRDPDAPRSDAPDQHYRRHIELWDLAAALVDSADDDQAASE